MLLQKQNECSLAVEADVQGKGDLVVRDLPAELSGRWRIEFCDEQVASVGWGWLEEKGIS